MLRTCLAFIAAVFSSLASAVTVTTDFSDMWWIPSESGWGANMIQQGDILFVTLFVYDSSGVPTWYVGPATAYGGTVSGAQHFSGPFYRVTGPYFGAAKFDPNAVNVTQVGTVTFDAQTDTTATLSYSVNGVNVLKNVQRQTWRTENLGGSYRGATIGLYTGCGDGTPVKIDNPNTLTLTQVVSNVTMSEFGTQAGVNYSCTYTGGYTQNGKMGTFTGTGVCNDGTHQSFTASNVQVTKDYISMELVADAGLCHFSGRIGGMREP